ARARLIVEGAEDSTGLGQLRQELDLDRCRDGTPSAGCDLHRESGAMSEPNSEHARQRAKAEGGPSALVRLDPERGLFDRAEVAMLRPGLDLTDRADA